VRVVLLDFGCVVAPDETAAGALAALIEAARLPGPAPAEEVLAGYVAVGFDEELLRPMAHLLPELNRVLFEPFATCGPFRVAEWRLGERVEAVLGQLRWNFRCSGPAAHIFLVRGYVGLLRYLRALNVGVDWSGAWEEIRGGLSAPAPARSAEGLSRPALARHLRVRVREAGQVRVELTFRAALAESLPDLVPPELEERLRELRVDVQAIAMDVAAHGFPPGDLFALTEDGKEVRVWLE
jgi:hypothetical protein